MRKSNVEWIVDLGKKEKYNIFYNAPTIVIVAAKKDAVFRQLFHGDPVAQALYFPAGTNANGALACIHDLGSGDVRSEGMSYGMMIAVQLDQKAEFDALWNWAKTFMYHGSPAHPSFGYFSWSMKTNGVANDEMPAPDGEEYFVTSLYFAASRWGNGRGIYNYRGEADRLLHDLRHRQPITGATVKGAMTAGAVFEPESKLVRFTPDLANWNHTDPSYQLPAFYEVWARCGPAADRRFWREAAAASREFFQRAANPVTGLAPDYANFDGTPWAAPWNPHSAPTRWCTPSSSPIRTPTAVSVCPAGTRHPRKGIERPHPIIFRCERFVGIRQPVYVGRNWIWRRPHHRFGGDECGCRAGGDESARAEICRGAVEYAGANGPVALLRRHVVSACAAALQR